MKSLKTKKWNHREYPVKHYMSAPGFCRWCQAEILKADGTRNSRKNWCNKRCVGHYLLRADPKVMRQHVFFRDKGQCFECGKIWHYLSDPWQADHLLPLFMAMGDLSYWEPENVRILCTDPCHKQKTKQDNIDYKQAAKILKCDDPSDGG